MRALALSLSTSILLLSAACNRAPTPQAGGVQAPRTDDDAAPPAPTVRDDATNLLFSYVDGAGKMQTVAKTADVPEAAKGRVLVVDLAKTPEQRQAHKYAFFADLTTQRPDGSYDVSIVSRYDASRPQAATGAALPAPTGSVVVYSATWCGFCKKAKAWLGARGVPFIERDVEKTAGAQAELDEKLRTAGVAGGGIPVIDWGGHGLVMGFDQAKLEALLRDFPPKAEGDGLTGADAGAKVP